VTTVLALVLLLVALAIGVVLVNAVVLQAWRQERRQLGMLADRLGAEARLEALTLRTLQEMRSAARSSMANRVEP
jgi:uncharacterized protein HemX